MDAPSGTGRGQPRAVLMIASLHRDRRRCKGECAFDTCAAGDGAGGLGWTDRTSLIMKAPCTD